MASIPVRLGPAAGHEAAGAVRGGALARARAYSYRVPHAVPEWDRSTFRALLRCFALGSIGRGPDVARLEREMARQLRAPRAVAAGSGRVAIELALRALGLGDAPDAEVLVPAFCCESVLAPIRAVGARPVLIDVGPDLSPTGDTVRAALSRRTRAVIVPHLFGNPVEMDPILDVCRRHGVAVVDDAAQALGAEVDGRSPGMLGDVGVVSFGNGKVCFGTGGGVLVSADADLLARAAATPMRRPGWPGALARVGSVLLWRRWRRWTLPARVLLARLGAREWPAPPYERTAMANVDAAVARSLLRGLGANVAGRRRRVALYENRLGNVPGLGLIPHRSGSACLTQVVSVRPRTPGAPNAVELVARLRDRGFEVHRSYRPLHRSPAGAGCASAALPVTEDVCDTLLELPCEPSVPEHLVREIAEHVVEAVSRPC